MKNQQIITKACSRVAPAWPLKNIAAVNPYLGMADLTFEQATKRFSRTAGINLTMPIQYYLDKIDEKEITSSDIKKAFAKNDEVLEDAENFADYARQIKDLDVAPRLCSVGDAALEVSGKNWNEFRVDKISSWASAYFDETLATWKTTGGDSDLFLAWKKDAETDMSTELMGIKGFRSILKKMPNDSVEASIVALEKLNVSEETLETYLHALLLKVVGWSSYIAGKDWDESLYGAGAETKKLQSFLSILLCWEVCLLESFESKGIESTWSVLKPTLENQDKFEEADQILSVRILLQDAYDFSSQRQLNDKFKAQKNTATPKRPKAQAVFCIDVRSEVYRRNLEQVDNEFETLGFAGFFGFAINYVPLAHKQGKNQCPVLIPSGPVVKETFKNHTKATKKRVGNHQVEKTWKSFKSGAVSSFGFVSPAGLTYLPKLISDSLGWSRPVKDARKDGLKKWYETERDLDLSAISLEDKITMAAGAVTGMGLKNKMAPLVLITGHGSTSVNNPHATGLDCGACGGHSGEINAMTAERILNDKEVRAGLLNQGVKIPEDTHFVACLHNTTTDEIELLGASGVPASHTEAFASVKNSLKLASENARVERSLRMNIKGNDVKTSIFKRGNDWSQVRPEWGLSGCNSFIIAPRTRTQGKDFGGRSFLHSYDWKTDEGFKVLEAIITAPMVVTSWINLQYFASTTDNKRFGAGNKTLHNVTGGIGVLEGSSGDLRIGLPWQSIHDGEKYQHPPQRLSVVIEAPVDAVNEILKNHSGVKDLCDNSWITLLILDEKGELKQRYAGSYQWDELIPNTNKEVKEKELITI